MRVALARSQGGEVGATGSVVGGAGSVLQGQLQLRGAGEAEPGPGLQGTARSGVGGAQPGRGRCGRILAEVLGAQGTWARESRTEGPGA